MTTHPHAGQPADASILVDLDRLAGAYYDRAPDPEDPAQRIAFGTSGHRGSSLLGSFNDAHIAAMSQAVCHYRRAHGIEGPLFLGRDTHGLSGPALHTAIEVMVANGLEVRVDPHDRPTATPAISHAILSFNRGAAGRGQSDGVVLTPSHNPPEDGGFKYNPPHGGPAGVDATGWIEREANRLLASGLAEVRRIGLEQARAGTVAHDYVAAYVDALPEVVDLEAIRAAGLTLGVDPLGGATVDLWQAIVERHGLDLRVVNPTVDPTFAFMRRDHDGKIRMDCSSRHAMAGLVELREEFDLAFGNDPDGDRHGVVTPGDGLLNPNHYLAASIAYLFGGARDWEGAGIGKTLVSSSMIDWVAEDLGRTLVEVPVGFKWFVDGLLDGSLGFGGEESAGASFLRRDGSAWSTDKDGVILCLLAAEATARTGVDPGQRYAALTERFGAPVYARVDVPAAREDKDALKALSPDSVTATELAGDPITGVLTRAPGNGAAIGGLKVTAEGGWFAARPSGTEDIYKLYAESYRDPSHLQALLDAAEQVVQGALGRDSG